LFGVGCITAVVPGAMPSSLRFGNRTTLFIKDEEIP
jgi:hypothetical protein